MSKDIEDLEGFDLIGDEDSQEQPLDTMGLISCDDGWDLIDEKNPFNDFGNNSFSGVNSDGHFGLSGREKCKALKHLRAAIAREYMIEGFEYTECPYEGPCKGTCPACEEELARLTAEVDKIRSEMDKKKKKTLFDKIFKRDPLAKQGIVLPPKPFESTEDMIARRSEDALYAAENAKMVKPYITLGMVRPDDSIETTGFSGEHPVIEPNDYPDILEGDVECPDTIDDDPLIEGGFGEMPYTPETDDDIPPFFIAPEGVDPETGNVSMDELEKLAREQNDSNES